MNNLISKLTIATVSVAMSQTISASEIDRFFAERGLKVIQVEEPQELKNISLSVIHTDQGKALVDLNKNIVVIGEAAQIQADGSSEDVTKNANKKLINSIPNKIVYPAKNEKHVIQMFTDVTCSACRELHKNIDEYSSNGITLEVMLFPRNGLSDKSALMMSKIKNKEQLQDAMNSLAPKTAKELSESVILHHMAGRAMGVSATPSFVINGQLVAGTLPASVIVDALK